jgi:Lrp/AsnC family transcriptional regulator for asnA, asnC and gidA
MDSCEIDSLDKKILRHLQEDSRRPYLEIARQIGCSGGTIHSRVSKLKDLGVISGQIVTIDKSKLGYEMEAYLGVTVDLASKFNHVSDKLKKIPEVTEVHYTTGSYSLLVKVAVKNTKDLFLLLSTKIQTINHISATDTLIVLDTLLSRDITLD